MAAALCRLPATILAAWIAAHGAAAAANIGLSLADGSAASQSLRKAIEEAAARAGHTVIAEDAQGDAQKQLTLMQNFVVSRLDALIVFPVDAAETGPIASLATDSGLPLVYLGRAPADTASYGTKSAAVAFNEIEAATFQVREACRIAEASGKKEGVALLMLGDLSDSTTLLRAKAAREGLADGQCRSLKLAEEQTAVGDRATAQDLMANWLLAGLVPDAVIATNDAMALGAVEALKASGMATTNVIVAGIGGDSDAMAAVRSGDLDVTVRQDIQAQGARAVDTITQLLQGGAVEPRIFVPNELVSATPGASD